MIGNEAIKPWNQQQLASGQTNIAIENMDKYGPQKQMIFDKAIKTVIPITMVWNE